MKVTIHQPSYLPWLGYLAKLAAADVFVLLDTVPFTKGALGWANRNYVKTANGPVLLTVPVRREHLLSRPLSETRIDERQPWRRKHMKTLVQAYRRAPNFELLWPDVENVLTRPGDRLVDLDANMLAVWLRWFGISTPVVRASELGVNGLQATEALVAICRATDCDSYLSGPLGRDYLDMPLFAAAGIAVDFHEYDHPVYPQLHGDFVPRLGALDAAMNGVRNV